jgi:hypothetical protein
MSRKWSVVWAAAVLLAAAPAGAAEPGQTVISSDYGSLTVAAIMQALLQGRIDGSDLNRDLASTPDVESNDVFENNHVDFALHRARIILKGNLLSPNLTYVFQGDATLPEFVLDARMSFVIPEGEGISTTISAGRYLPPFTLILPRLVSRLDAINYPLYLFTPWATGARMQPFASTNTTGRQVGVLITQKLTPMFQLDFGVFNGFQRTPLTGGWADDNDYKDFFVRAAIKPIDGLLFALDFWAGFPVSLDSGIPDDTATPANEYRAPRPFGITDGDPTWENDSDYFAVFETEITLLDPVKIMGEFAYTHQTIRSMDATVDPEVRASSTIDGIGAWFHVGYLFKDLLAAGADFELVARFDYFDPDINTADNGQMRVTFGPHFLLEGLHSQLRLNYMFNISQSALTPGDEAWDDMRHEIWLQAVVEI